VRPPSPRSAAGTASTAAWAASAQATTTPSPNLFQGLKRELLHGRRYTSKAHTRLELCRWLAYYNRRRRHSALGYRTPVEFEHQLITSRTLSLVA
jgi:transposase InsO family protein